MKLLLEHLSHNKDALLKYSELIGVANHPVNLGTAREGLISNFLKQNLPEYIRYQTGEIFDSQENRSGQIDIVLHPITSPKINLHNAINIFPAETVLAAIEIKSTLTTGKKTGSLSEALTSCEKLKQLEILRSSNNSADIVDPQRVPFIIFSYKGPTLNTLKKHLRNYCSQSGKDYRIAPDLIMVLDRGYYLVKTKSWMSAGTSFDEVYKVKEEKDFVLLGIYEFILKLIEYWFLNPQEHTMPINQYTKDMPSIFKFFA